MQDAQDEKRQNKTEDTSPKNQLPKPSSATYSSTMSVKEHQPLVDGCCTFCCKAVDFGTHDYCGNNYACPRCPD